MGLEGFVKFPRTHHLMVLSKNVSRDDLTLKDTKPFYTEKVIVEEKIDGSNLGLSVDPNTYKILAQNRSHYVNSKSHSQFAGLDRWINEHPKLFEILYPDFILFGEWVYAKHSVPYDKLPGYFIAFDIYDKKKNKFLSVQRRNEKLKGSGIPIIKTIASGVFKKPEDYKKLLEKPSFYRKKGNLEGIYLRIDEGDYLKYRAKVVREDFIQQIEQHWSTKILEKNTIDFESLYDEEEENSCSKKH